MQIRIALLAVSAAALSLSMGSAGAQGTGTSTPPAQPLYQWQTFPGGTVVRPLRVRAQRYPRGRNNRARTQNGNRGPKTAHINPNDKAPVDLASSVQSLKQRHAAAVAKLPVTLRADDRHALPVVEQLPLVAQEAYLVTVEDYPNVDVSVQGKLAGVMRGLSGLPGDRQPAYVAAATKSFETMGADPKTLAAARKTPHETCFRLLDSMPR